MQEHLFKHLKSMAHNGFHNNVSITLLIRPTVRTLKREDYWRKTLKIYLPFALNVENSV